MCSQAFDQDRDAIIVETDEDWLEDEFQAAKKCYHSRPREEIRAEVERKQKEESQKFTLERRRAFLERQQEPTENE